WPEALTQPLSIMAFSGLTVVSIWRHRRGQITWKGRTLP
ncbi:MAG TPA: glycosyl transferase, partial [Actinobacteria bacterium]|nr:glycosyl transferase [Actinomycetota bacterium]